MNDGANLVSFPGVLPDTFTLGEFAISHPPRKHRVDRKSLQLCRQVADTLNQVLTGECDDEILRSLYVVSVTPAPDTTQLMVIVSPLLPGEILQPADVLARLSTHSGHLRDAVASAITRRKAPRLLFQFAASDASSQPPRPTEDSY
ncbi:MAG: ribosome-binding factor A [Planctomycetes bacterium]|nr:ribosome-binding factor A [Planctomycetota bacterium]